MKKVLVLLFATSAALAACGGKGNGASTPSNAGGTTSPKKDGAPMGGATYGSAATTEDPCAAPADPCAAPH